MIVYGHELRLPAQLGDGVTLPAVDEPAGDTPPQIADYARRLNATLRAAWTAAREASSEEQERTFRDQWSTAHTPSYEVGDRVCHRLRDKGGKLQSEWSVPCRVAEVLGQGNYRLTDLANCLMTDTFHVSRLRPYRPHADEEALAPDESLVDRLVGHRDRMPGSVREYRVKWRGYPLSKATYEPRDELMRRCQPLVEEYDAKNLPMPDMSVVTGPKRGRGTRRSDFPPAGALIPSANVILPNHPLLARFRLGRWEYLHLADTPRGPRYRARDMDWYDKDVLYCPMMERIRINFLHDCDRDVARHLV